jgi:uncharacterized membrane protein YbaN (DUF454 family)
MTFMETNHSYEKKLNRDKLKRGLFVFAGTVSLGLACFGIVLPILPTTPFLLLSAGCYLKGSKRMHTWLLNHKLFGQYIRNYVEGKGISLKAKVFMLTLMWIAISYAALFTVPLLIIQVALFVIALAVTIHLIKVPTYKGQ